MDPPGIISMIFGSSYIPSIPLLQGGGVLLRSSPFKARDARGRGRHVLGTPSIRSFFRSSDPLVHAEVRLRF